MATESSPPKIEWFRLRLIPASVLAVFGCLMLFGEADYLYHYIYPNPNDPIAMTRRVPTNVFVWEVTSISLMALTCLVTAWLVMKRRWVILTSIVIAEYFVLQVTKS